MVIYFGEYGSLPLLRSFEKTMGRTQIDLKTEHNDKSL